MYRLLVLFLLQLSLLPTTSSIQCYSNHNEPLSPYVIDQCLPGIQCCGKRDFYGKQTTKFGHFSRSFVGCVPHLISRGCWQGPCSDTCFAASDAYTCTCTTNLCNGSKRRYAFGVVSIFGIGLACLFMRHP